MNFKSTFHFQYGYFQILNSLSVFLFILLWYLNLDRSMNARDIIKILHLKRRYLILKWERAVISCDARFL